MRFVILLALHCLISGFATTSKANDSLGSIYDTKYFVQSSVNPLQKGELYYSSYLFSYNFITAGIGWNSSIKLGFNPQDFLADEPLAYVDIQRSSTILPEYLHLNYGIKILSFLETQTFYGISTHITVGNPLNNIAFGLAAGKFTNDQEMTEEYHHPFYLAGNVWINDRNAVTGEWYYFHYREKWSSRGGMGGGNELTQEIVGILAVRNKRKLFEFTYGLCLIPTRTTRGQFGTLMPFFGFNFDMRQLRWWEQ